MPGYAKQRCEGNYDFEFKIKDEWKKEAHKFLNEIGAKGKKVCLVRRPTVRKEWAAPGRNPKPEYFELIQKKFSKDLFFLSLAANKKDEEWFVGDFKADHENEKGLPIGLTLGLISECDINLNYPSFFMLAAIALRSKCFCIFGGMHCFNSILSSDMGLDNFSYVQPDPFCDCWDREHDCYKDIPEEKILEGFGNIFNV